MVFSSTIFLFLFLPITLLGYYLLNPSYRNVFLLIVSLAFYAWGEPRFVAFFYNKYLDFAIVNINAILGREVLSLRNIALPIGISFFTFQAMSYVIDVYRNNGRVQKNPLNVGLYITFFPQLIAGPIVG